MCGALTEAGVGARVGSRVEAEPTDTEPIDAEPTNDLAAALDALLALDPDGLDDDELGAALVAVHRHQARLAAVAARLTGALDARGAWAGDGSRSCAGWIARRCRVPPAEARASVRLARRLLSMPATSRALASGDIGVAHAQRLAALNGPRTATAFAEAEQTLVGHASSSDWVDFSRVATYWHHAADPADAEDRAADDASLRRVHLSPGLDGTGLLDGVLTPVARAAVGGALERIERELFEADWADARVRLGDAVTPADLARTPAQRRHDALVEMAHRAMTAPADGKRPRPLVTVLCGYETFAGRICELADGTIVTPGTVAGLLDEAVVERVVFDGPSRVVDVGHARLFTGALRRAVEVRDRHCTHPGCHVPAERCDIDHVRPHADGGATDQANGRLVCKHHHRHRHRTVGQGQPSG